MGIGIAWLPRFCGGLGGPMGSICRPNDRIVRKSSAGQNRPWKFWVWDFWSKMTIFFDFPKMCLKSHIWVFYRFRKLSRSQMADFRPYMKNPKNLILGWFLQFWHNWPIYVVAGSGWKWPEVSIMAGNMFSEAFRCLFIPISVADLNYTRSLNKPPLPPKNFP